MLTNSAHSYDLMAESPMLKLIVLLEAAFEKYNKNISYFKTDLFHFSLFTLNGSMFYRLYITVINRIKQTHYLLV